MHANLAVYDWIIFSAYLYLVKFVNGYIVFKHCVIVTVYITLCNPKKFMRIFGLFIYKNFRADYVYDLDFAILSILF